MIFFINLNKKFVEFSLVSDRKIINQLKWKSDFSLSEKLLIKIDQFLTKNNLKIESLKAIVVYKGPESYTGLRIIIATLNALSFAIKIPLIGISQEEIEKSQKSFIVLGIEKFKKKKFSQFLIPIYWHLPKITKPKFS